MRLFDTAVAVDLGANDIFQIVQKGVLDRAVARVFTSTSGSPILRHKSDFFRLRANKEVNQLHEGLRGGLVA